MDTSCLDDQQKAYVSTMRARILAAQMGGFEGGTSNGSNGLLMNCAMEGWLLYF